MVDAPRVELGELRCQSLALVPTAPTVRFLAQAFFFMQEKTAVYGGSSDARDALGFAVIRASGGETVPWPEFIGRTGVAAPVRIEGRLRGFLSAPVASVDTMGKDVFTFTARYGAPVIPLEPHGGVILFQDEFLFRSDMSANLTFPFFGKGHGLCLTYQLCLSNVKEKPCYEQGGFRAYSG